MLNEYVQAEVDLQAAGADAFDKLLRPPAMWTAFPAGHIELTGAQAARLYRIGLKPNWPDHLVLHDGKLIGIEWKTVDGELSRSRTVHTKRGAPRYISGQRDVFPMLKRAGMLGPHVCMSVEAALNVLAAYGVPMANWRIAA